MYRFTYGSLLRHGLLYADPHPGNYLFQPERGQVWILDFGCIQLLEPDFVRLTRRMHRAAMDGRPDVVRGTFCEALQAQPTREELDLLELFLINYVYRPFSKDEEFEFTEDYAREVIEWTLKGASLALKNILGRGTKEAGRTGAVWLNRILIGFNNVLGALGARANFHRLHRDMLQGFEEDGLSQDP